MDVQVNFFIPCGIFCVPYLGKAQQSQKQRLQEMLLPYLVKAQQLQKQRLREMLSPYLVKAQQLQKQRLREMLSPYLGKAQQLQEQCYPFLSVCAVLVSAAFYCVQTMVWLPVFGICDVCTDVMYVTAHGGCMVSLVLNTGNAS